jgi:hypothetical protein
MAMHAASHSPASALSEQSEAVEAGNGAADTYPGTAGVRSIIASAF